MKLTLTSYGSREIKFIIIVFAAWALILAFFFPHALPWPQIVAALLMLAGLAFFRDPRRNIPTDQNILLAPADGKITDIIEMNETDYLKGPALRIGIFLSIFDVHINRTPCAGTVEYIQEKPGKCFNALRFEDASRENQSASLGLSCPQHPAQKVLIKQITGAIARRIVYAPRLGDHLEAGYKYGMIKFGSRTELFLLKQENAQILVKKGDIVRAGTTILVKYA